MGYPALAVPGHEPMERRKESEYSGDAGGGNVHPGDFRAYLAEMQRGQPPDAILRSEHVGFNLDGETVEKLLIRQSVVSR